MAQKRQLASKEVLCVYRVVKTDKHNPVDLEPSFCSNKQKGRPARDREITDPEIWDSLSVYKSLQGARDLHGLISRRIAGKGPVRIGDHVAELRLESRNGIEYEDLNEPDGHMSIWGSSLDLATCVVDIYPADPGPGAPQQRGR